jgi:hypothetical protein
MTRRRPLFLALLLVALAAALLIAMGRPPICTCGTVELWVNQGDSPKTSQMLADWYSPSHIIHGVLFYAVLWLMARRWPVERRFLIAVTVEVAWELIENSSWAINRYREATIAIGYTGDSVLNTVSDIAMMALGFWLARKLPVWVCVLLVVLLEIAALIAVRDNLTLNIWMFLFPTDFIRQWQAGSPARNASSCIGERISRLTEAHPCSVSSSQARPHCSQPRPWLAKSLAGSTCMMSTRR